MYREKKEKVKLKVVTKKNFIVYRLLKDNKSTEVKHSRDSCVNRTENPFRL